MTTVTSLLSRSLLRRVTSGIPRSHGLDLDPSARILRSPSRTASSTSVGDPLGQEPAMDSPIKVVSHMGGGGGGDGGGGATDAGRSARKPLSLWPGMYHSPVANALWEARSSIFERMIDASANEGRQQQRPQTELLTKTPAQSRTSIIHKFASEDILRESGGSTGTRGTWCASASCSRISTRSPAPSLSRYLAMTLTDRHFLYACKVCACIGQFKKLMFSILWW
jgi:hypothetical protein